MSSFGIGVVGLGVMGRRMAEAMQSRSTFRLVCGYDPFANTKGLDLRSDLHAVINDPLVDCVYIASPPASHREAILAAAGAGKAIFCEKPLTASIEESRLCVDAVAAAGVAAATNFPFATAPAAVRLQKLVESGALGRITETKLTLRFKSWPRSWQADAAGWLAQAQQGGFTREVLSHFAFLAQRIFGPASLRSCQVERGDKGTETELHASVLMGDTVLVIDGAVGGDVEDFNRFEVRGSDGAAALTDWYRLEYLGQTSEREAPLEGQLDALEQMLAGRAHPLATFQEAAATANLIESLLAS